MRSTKQVNNKLEKSANYIQFDWVEFMSKEYFGVVEAVNECYKKMLEIGKCKEVFRRVDGDQCELLTANSKNDIYYDIMMDNFLKTHYLDYFFIIPSRDTQITARAISSSNLTASLEKPTNCSRIEKTA